MQWDRYLIPTTRKAEAGELLQLLNSKPAYTIWQDHISNDDFKDG